MEKIREEINKIIKTHKLKDTIVRIKTKVLSTEEAIGNPEHDDYPIQKGRERLMQASFQGACGVAFTDRFGDYEGSLYEIINMELSNNFRRAVFISTINAILSYLGLISKTEHCKDGGLVNCQKKAVSFIKESFAKPKIFHVGFQPRLIEALTKEFEIRITDMDRENIGKKVNGIVVESTETTEKNIEWCDLIFATGSCFVNETYNQFIVRDKPTIFYGVTCAGAVYLLNLKRYCPEGL